MDRQKLIASLNEAISFVKDNHRNDIDHQKLIVSLEQAMAAALAPDVPQLDPAIVELLKSDAWPEAVPQFLICNDNESDKKERAEGMLSYINENLKSKTFLDFGCGEGHFAYMVSDKASKSVGYDLSQLGSLDWETETKCLLTTDFNKVLNHAPYDLICLYDVLDHCQDVSTLLNQLKSVCGPNTKVYVRCHSWMSRHGTHLYKQLNKAWIHLFFTDEELSLMGLKSEYTRKYFFPIKTQQKWFSDSGFAIIESSAVRSEVESFFSRPELISRLPIEFKNCTYLPPAFQMEQVFNDYVLKVIQ